MGVISSEGNGVRRITGHHFAIVNALFFRVKGVQVSKASTFPEI